MNKKFLSKVVLGVSMIGLYGLSLSDDAIAKNPCSYYTAMGGETACLKEEGCGWYGNKGF